MNTYVVIDTNVLVSALLSKHHDSSTVRVLEFVFLGNVIPLFDSEILSEYEDVLHRKKFKLPESLIRKIIDEIVRVGEPADRILSDEKFVDPKDIVFYEVALSKENSFLVTGNLRHFPRTPMVVSPAQLLEIIETQR